MAIAELEDSHAEVLNGLLHMRGVLGVLNTPHAVSFWVPAYAAAAQHCSQMILDPYAYAKHDMPVGGLHTYS